LIIKKFIKIIVKRDVTFQGENAPSSISVRLSVCVS